MADEAGAGLVRLPSTIRYQLSGKRKIRPVIAARIMALADPEAGIVGMT